MAEMLSTGELTLSVVSMISDILNKKNADEVLSWIRGKSTRDAEMLVSRHRPGYFLRDRVKSIYFMTEHTGRGDNSSINNKLHPAATSNKCKASLTITPGAGSKCKAGLTSNYMKSPPNAPGENAAEQVLITQKFKLEFAVDPGFIEKLARVRSLLSSKYPKGINLEQLFQELLDEYLYHHDPKNRNKKRARDQSKAKKAQKDIIRSTARTEPPRSTYSGDTARSINHSRYIPKSIRDTVFERDGGRCTFVGEDGKRCNSDWNLQIDHIVPYARGGDNSSGNLRLLCAQHNLLTAEQEYGADFMKKYYRRG
ncbi:MAG: HNH endonuclease [bacterium]|nr:MAG: HNH endonuclease [bacterium]